MKVLTTAATGTPDWLAARKGKIGGNMAADILGCGRRTILQAWAELTEKVEPEDLSSKPYIRRGNLLEPAILRGFSEDSGYSLMPSPGLIQHDAHPFLAGTPDALYLRAGKDGKVGVIDAKAVGFYKVGEWKAGVPLRVQVQTAFYALLLGPAVDWHAAAAMPIDDDEEQAAILWDEQPVNQAVLYALEQKLVEFWERHVIPDIPPDPNPVADRETIKRLFPRDDGTAFPGTPEMLARWRRIEEIRGIVGPLEKEKKALTSELEIEFGTQTYADFGDFRLKYAQEHKDAYEVQAWSGRVLRKVKA